MSAAISIASAAVDWRPILVVLAICLASLALGRAVLTLPLPAFRTAGEFLAGALVASLMVFGACRLFVISAGMAALLTAVIVIAATVLFRRRSAQARTAWPDLVLMLLVCLAAFIWSWQATEAVPRLFASGEFDAWTDYFIHAGEISQFANYRSLHGTTIFAAGAPLPLYHYGSYMFSAVLSGLTGLPSLTAATAFWTPFGFILLGLGAAVLGGVLAGETGGFLAVATLLLVPSASHYGLANPFFDVHWLLQVSSSSDYGIACASLSICALVLWLRGRQAAALAWAVLFTLATFEFRVQIFAPLALANALIWFLAWRPARPWWRLALVMAGALMVIAIMFFLQHIQRAPHFFSGSHHPIGLMLMMFGMAPGHEATLYQRLATGGPQGVGTLHGAAILAIGIVMLIIAAFGVLLPLYLAALLWRRQACRRRVEDLIPLAGLLAYLAILVSFPANPDEKLEFAHRPYILVYALLAIWCASFATELIRPAAWHRPAAAILAFGLLITPLCKRGKNPGNLLFFACADSRPWTLCIMCRPSPPFPR